MITYVVVLSKPWGFFGLLNVSLRKIPIQKTWLSTRPLIRQMVIELHHLQGSEDLHGEQNLEDKSKCRMDVLRGSRMDEQNILVR